MTFEREPRGWRTETLSDIAVEGGLVGGPFGSSLGRKDYVETGVPVIRGNNIREEGRFDDRDLVFVTEEKAEKDLRRNTAAPGDIILTQRGTLGQVGVVPHGSYPAWVISQSQERLRVDQTKADPGFIYFVLRSPALVDEIKRRAITTGVPHINLEITRELPILLPPLDEQKRIAGVLSLLDNKNENNRRLARSLEEIVAALFKARFVDFIGCDNLVDSEVGIVPRGWEVGCIGDMCVFEYGKALPAKAREPGKAVVVGSSGIVGSHKEGLYGGPGIVVGRKGTAGSVTWVNRDFFPIDTTFVALAKEDVPPLYLLHALRQANFPHVVSDSAVPGLNRDVAYAQKISLPPRAEMKSFESAASPCYALRDQLLNSADTLEAVRDALLPRLTSGQLRIPSEKVAPESA